ncbi:DUF2865 domain-containing protein [Xanthobacter autotrophicus]|uniref:DUF2865 domain-containing protein n=2 Tax=Xanthobacter TaxID=279 RepID=UPI0024AAE8CC|nr:DUF2865 domain-containing protein [Xanthobacter autotrophicus]MDI4665963.1 DUF2865 domain-containing protein [Xanthobacter autotrophicus]
MGAGALELARILARKFAFGLLLAGPATGAATQALAQAGSPACMQLESSLMSLDRGANGAAAQQQQAAKLRSDLDRLTSQARGMGCDAPRGFLIFQGPPRPPQCDQIDDQVSRLRSQLAGMERGGSDQSGQRRALILALAQNNCGPQYTAAVQAARRPSEPQKPRNFFEAIFGTPQSVQEEESAPDLATIPLDQPKQYSSRTVCVRTCDGYFFPMANSTNSSRYAQDDQLCKRLCPGSEAQLFTYSGDIRSAVSVSGQSYMSLPNALRYRKELVPSCTCKPAGQSWAQALAGLEDETTLRKGDILVTEEQAREMSQPKFNEPGSAKGKGAAARAPATAASEAAGGPVAATAAAPLAPASEQPGQRQVRIIPLPRSQNAQNQQTTPGAGQGTAQ